MISVCYSGNGKIFKGLVLSVMSMIKHTDEPVDIILLSMDLTDVNKNFTSFSLAQVEFLDNMVKEKNPSSRVRLIDTRDLYIELLSKGKNAKNGYTPYTLLRLLLDRLPDIPDKLLYIDIDTMFKGNVKELYDTDISDYELAAVRDHVGKVFIRPSYFNAGVVLFNIKRAKQTDLFAKSREKVNRVKMIMPDQTAMNRYAKKKLYLNRRFNEQRKIKEDTIIKHFCKNIKYYGLFITLPNIKQWDIENVHKKLKIFDFDDIYSEYKKLSLPE